MIDKEYEKKSILYFTNLQKKYIGTIVIEKLLKKRRSFICLKNKDEILKVLFLTDGSLDTTGRSLLNDFCDRKDVDSLFNNSLIGKSIYDLFPINDTKIDNNKLLILSNIMKIDVIYIYENKKWFFVINTKDVKKNIDIGMNSLYTAFRYKEILERRGIL